jgi:ketosteroid isomerase-like protein
MSNLFKFEGWNPFKKAVAGIVKKVSTWKLTPRVIKVKQWDKVGLTTATSVFSGKFKTGKKFTANMRHTAIWEKKGNRRQIIHEHWSIPWPTP